jgi:hypothetical protein
MKNSRAANTLIGVMGGLLFTGIGVLFYAVIRGYTGLFMFSFPDFITNIPYDYGVFIPKSNYPLSILMGSFPSCIGAIAVCFLGSVFFNDSSLLKCCSFVFLFMSIFELAQQSSLYASNVDARARFDPADIISLFIGCLIGFISIKRLWSLFK